MMDEAQLSTSVPVVIPCSNGEAVIHELYRRVTQACRSLVGGRYELVFVNDGFLR
jgi:hypothetical protein